MSKADEIARAKALLAAIEAEPEVQDPPVQAEKEAVIADRKSALRAAAAKVEEKAVAAAAPPPGLDRSKPYGEVGGSAPVPGGRYVQDGKYFDHQGRYIKEQSNG